MLQESLFRVLAVSVALLLTLGNIPPAAANPAAQEQACAGEAAQIRDVAMSAVRTGESAIWADGSASIQLTVDDEKAVCWVNADGEVQQVALGEPSNGANPSQEQACAGEAAQINDVEMSALRVRWSTLGLDGMAWIRLELDDEPLDCLVSGSGEVQEVAAMR